MNQRVLQEVFKILVELLTRREEISPPWSWISEVSWPCMFSQLMWLSILTCKHYFQFISSNDGFTSQRLFFLSCNHTHSFHLARSTFHLIHSQKLFIVTSSQHKKTIRLLYILKGAYFTGFTCFGLQLRPSICQELESWNMADSGQGAFPEK